jgi:hypothetical protein
MLLRPLVHIHVNSDGRHGATRGAPADREGLVNGLVHGLGAVRPDASWRGMERLASAIEAARRR